MGVFTIESIRTKNGSQITVPSPGVLCVVGGNNVGKSQFLRDIPVCLSDDLGARHSSVLIEKVDTTMALSSEESDRWFLANSIEESRDDAPRRYRAPGGSGRASVHDFQQLLAMGKIGQILGWFVRSLDASERSSVATIQAGSGSLREKSNALNELFRDGDLEAELSSICNNIFGFPLTLDRVNGNVMLRVGVPDIPSPPLQHPTRDYSDKVLALPPVHAQGDGVKNYLGMVLHMMTGTESISMLDEPEAFLHPAQARALGRYLGRVVQDKERQLITATHDRDFVLGLLDSETPLTILRINRDGDTNTFTSIDSDVIAAIWSKPALRYSNLLQGLFHRSVVLCEADGDCQWYAAVTDLVGEENGVSTEEVLFVPGGGKEQLPSSLRALEALEVTAFTITDFDSLLEPDYIKALLEAKGLSDEEVIKKSQSLVKDLENSNRKKQAKESGISGVSPGTCTKMATELISSLRDRNILVVPVGEIESFDRSIGGHGPAWVSAALTKGSHKSSVEAKELVKVVVQSLTTAN